MLRKIVVGWIASILLLVSSARAVQSEAFERGLSRARAELVLQLVELAAWCKEAKLPASRAALYGEVLQLEPGNEAAREGLGHKKQRDGTWKEPAPRRATAADQGATALAELAERRAAVDDAYCKSCIELLEANAAEVGARRRAALVEELLARAPENARVRALTGETRDEGAWVLEETVTAKARRAELREMLQRIFAESSEPSQTMPKPREKAFPIEWKTVVDAKVARVLGTGRPEEVVTFGRVMQVAQHYFEEAFGVEANYYPDATCFLLANEGEKEVFLSNHPKVDEKYRKFLVKLEGTGIDQSGDFVYWASDERLRIDGSTRIALSMLFRDAFKISALHGWIFEGFGLYLTRELVGTRLTWFARPSEMSTAEEDMALRARLLDPKTNWMDEAQKVLNSDRSPRLVFVMGKDVNSLTPEDLLLSYVAAAYLLEGCPEETPELLRRIGNGTLAPTAVEEIFGMDVHAFDARMRRWLSERK